MARSRLYRQLAGVGLAVARGLGTLVDVQLYQGDRENRNPLTGEPSFPAAPVDVQVEIRGADGQAVGSDNTDPGSRLVVMVFDPDVAVSQGDYFTWGDSAVRHTVQRVGGPEDLVQDVAGVIQDGAPSRYVSRCLVD